jgi:hypothetical protein
MGYKDRIAVVIVWYNPASGGLGGRFRLGPAMAIYMTKPELRIGAIGRIVGVLEPYRLVA